MAREILDNADSKEKHDALHHGYETDVPIPAAPYLTLPFSKQELESWIRHVKNPRFDRRRLYNISEGTIYSAAEQSIHGKVTHAAIDYDVPYGTPIAAPTSGYVMSSYESFWLKKDDKPVLLKGKQIAMGLGYFVQLYDPRFNRFLQIGHLSDIHEEIPFSLPTQDEDGDWVPSNTTVSVQEMVSGSLPFVTYVERGDPLGLVGWSGLRWGYNEYRPGDERPTPLDYKLFPSWDEAHAHVEEYYRNQETGKKTPRRDPYDIYLTGDEYPTPTRRRLMGPEPLFYLGPDELPKFADDHI